MAKLGQFLLIMHRNKKIKQITSLSQVQTNVRSIFPKDNGKKRLQYLAYLYIM